MKQLLRHGLVLLAMAIVQPASAKMELLLRVANIQDTTYRIALEPRVQLEREVIDAVRSGIEVRVRLDVQSRSDWRFWYSSNIEKDEHYYELSYRPLASVYQIRQRGRPPQTTDNLNQGIEDALREYRYELEWKAGIDTIRARLKIDIDELPGPMRLGAWFTGAWRDSTGWVRWQP